MKKQYKEPKIDVLIIMPREAMLDYSRGTDVETEGGSGLSVDGEGDADEGLSKGRNSWDIFGE